MEYLWNDGWIFVKLPTGSTMHDAERAVFCPVDLPHDWLIGQKNLYETADAWYRKSFDVQDTGKVYLLRFDGVYMDAEIFANGQLCAVHHNGYTAFDVNLTPFIRKGANTVHVHIRHVSPNSRWYSGSGIYRDATLNVLNSIYIVPDSLYVHTKQIEQDYSLSVSAELSTLGFDGFVTFTLSDQSGNEICTASAKPCEASVHADMFVKSPKLWSPDEPNFYLMTVSCLDQCVTKHVGFKTVVFDAERGMFLNGRHIKLNGVCLHHDLGALGSAFHEKAMRRQLRVMRQMGVNALRTSHNPPASIVMDLCDEMGIMVMDELTDVWELPKTKYDYARFFKDDVASDVKSWICRDRNHPSLIMWSIGNEIYDTHASEHGQELTRMLKDMVLLHDPEGNAPVTFGCNYMPWENAQKCADILDLQGYNYAERLYAEHHAAHPDWLIYGSETSSILYSRGIYHFPIDTDILAEEDLHCSALGNTRTSWGAKSIEECLVYDQNVPYSLGQFLWAGIDYIGEPTPYQTRSCYFGQTDTACFPKDMYYFVKSIWTNEPFVHLGTSWDFNDGQLIDVPVSTTGDEVELILNGKSLGKRTVDLRDVSLCRPVWRIPYEAGTLEAVAYRDKQVIARDVRHSFGNAAEIMLKAEDHYLLADGHDMTFIEVTMNDKDGFPVRNANNRVFIHVSGSGRLMGTDNGDSADWDSYQASSRRLFSGKLLIMVGASDVPGDLSVTVQSEGIPEKTLTIPVIPSQKAAGRSCVTALTPSNQISDTPVRKLTLKNGGPIALNKEHPTCLIHCTVSPKNATYHDIAYRIVNASGIDSLCAVAVPDDGGVLVKGCWDGHAYLRATVKNGTDHACVISQLELTVTGFGAPRFDPYDFVCAGLYDIHDGEIGCGNEHGVSFEIGKASMIGFSGVDFGAYGSDEITLPIFGLSSDIVYKIRVYDGDPRLGGTLIDTLLYHKPCIWDQYQPETYKLSKRLSGIRTICFEMDEKAQLKGFSFTKQSRTTQVLRPLEADSIYGDSFVKDESRGALLSIGNNVTLSYTGMTFEKPKYELEISGATCNAINTITVRMTDKNGQETTALVDFAKDKGANQHFALSIDPGEYTVSFVFLPGSDFDFYSFRFNPA